MSIVLLLRPRCSKQKIFFSGEGARIPPHARLPVDRPRSSPPIAFVSAHNSSQIFAYVPNIEVQNIAMRVSVCLCVCPLTYLNKYQLSLTNPANLLQTKVVAQCD